MEVAISAGRFVAWPRRDQLSKHRAARAQESVVSNDGANLTAERLGRGMITVVPVTSNTDRVYPFQVLLPADVCGLERDSKAQAEQVRSVTFERIGRRVGTLSPELIAALDEALRLHLAL
jgi:mRNA interferase MazF